METTQLSIIVDKIVTENVCFLPLAFFILPSYKRAKSFLTPFTYRDNTD